jgi:hypothetical protein
MKQIFKFIIITIIEKLKNIISKLEFLIDCIEYIINSNKYLSKIKEYILQEPIPEMRKSMFYVTATIILVINKFDLLEKIKLDFESVMYKTGYNEKQTTILIILIYFLSPILVNIIFDIIFKIFNIKKPEPYLRDL